MLASKILKRPMSIPEEMPVGYLISVCYERFIMMIRGAFSLRFKKKGGVLFRGKRVEIHCKSMISMGNGVTLQDYVEINAMSKDGIKIGNNVSIGKRSIIRTSGSVSAIGKGFSIGDFSSLGHDCFVGAAGGVHIGNYVAIGQYVRFHSENHNFDSLELPIHEQGVSNKGIEIGNDCWIGSGVVFLDGVHVGNGCVIGANTLVNKDIPDNSVAVGNPVKILRKRAE